MAKATHWTVSDAEVRKLGERTGLDTPVVLAVKRWALGRGDTYGLPCRSKCDKCPAWGVRSQG